MNNDLTTEQKDSLKGEQGPPGVIVELNQDIKDEICNLTEQKIQDNTSIDEFGSRIDSLSGTLNVSDSDALSIAKQRLAQFSTTSVRIDGLIVNPLSDTSLWTQALTRELGDKITIKIPTPASTTMEFDVHIERISHTVSAVSRTWTWQLRTSAGSEVASWVLGSSRLGESTNLAF